MDSNSTCPALALGPLELSHASTASVSLWIAPPPLTLLTPGCPLKPLCRRCRRHQPFSSLRPLATAMETSCHDWFQIFFPTQSFRKFKLALNHLYYFPHAIHFSNDSRSVMSNSLQPHGLYSPWNSPGQNTGVGCLSLLGILLTQKSNSGLPHCRQTLYQLFLL